MRASARTASSVKWAPPVAAGLLVLLLQVLLTGCGLPGTIPTGGHMEQVSATPTAAPLPPIEFPQDEAPHHDLTEWWYYTGHFQTVNASGDPHEYGFELTFFQTLRGAYPPYYAAHFAISDISGGAFYFDQRAGFLPASVIPPPGSTVGFNLALGGWSMRGLNGDDELSADMSNYAISFQLKATKPVVLEGQNGLITYGAAGFSYYYSRTRMRIMGTLTDHGQKLEVTGQAWMDHQWGNFVSLLGAGWDWYSVQLDNNTEYMLYVIRDSQKQPIATVGTYVDSSGGSSQIGASDISTHALSTWTSRHTGAVYPSGWSVEIASQHLSLTLTPQLLDQELLTTASTGNVYWEGAVRISGALGSRSVDGVGYVELTGYASAPSSS
ncbi:MAG: lipocalin-like domain-containing protein [Ktedonobacterales bacterium]